MTREQWERIKQIFNDALEREPAEREFFVLEAAKDEPELVTELLRLVAESNRESGLLSQPAFARAKPLHETETLGFSGSNDELPQFSPSTVLAKRFRIIRFIARGGMGEVYEAEDLELGERIALKTIRRRVAPDAKLLALFKQEIQLARRVTHINVCRIFDFAQHEDPETGAITTLLSMQLLDCHTLADHLRQNGPFTFQEALPLIENIAAGLQAIHDAGIIHGDLKPANVMLTERSGETKLCAVVTDFGMALPVSPDQSGQVVSHGGTPEYLAPEQAKGLPVTTATDVYALALVIADMLGVPRPGRLKPDAERMPPRWARVLQRSLAGAPERRYSRPADMARALRVSAGQRIRVATRVAGAALFLALGIFGGLFVAGHLNTIRATAQRQLFTEGNVVLAWNPSPDGRSIVATSLDTGELVLRDVDNGKIRSITKHTAAGPGNSGWAYEARFSPDGRWLAYLWHTENGSELELIAADGSGERTLYRNPDVKAMPLDWSQDGKLLLARFMWNDNAQQMGIISVHDGKVRFVKTPGQKRIEHVVFAPDGDGLIYDAETGQTAGLEIYRLASNGVESKLVEPPGTNSIIGWAPDHRRLVFASDRRGQPGIWAVPVSARGEAGEPQELVPHTPKVDPLGITGAGSLVYRQDAETVDVYTAALDLDAGKAIAPPQRVPERLIGSNDYPSWSEDGTKLVFGSTYDANHSELLIYQRVTGRLRELPVDLAYLWRPQWTDHGKSIVALGTARDGRQGQFRIDPATGEATLFKTVKELDSKFEGVWSPDGKIQYNRYTDSRRGVFRLNCETGERKALYVPPAGVDLGLENLALSPDGRTLAFQVRNNAAGKSTLIVIPTEGGEARPLLTIKRPEVFLYGSFAWTPDSRRILTARTKNEVSEIWQIPVDGGPAAKIEFPPLRVSSLRLNSDGKTIAFAMRKWRSEIWVLQNFL